MAGGAVAVAAGFPDLSTAGYIPTLFSKRIIRWFYALCILTMVTNTNYSGELKAYGDRLTMRQLPSNAQIRTGVVGQDLVYDAPLPSSMDLVINQFRYFAIDFDEIQRMQSDIPYMEQFALHYSELLKIAIETGVFVDMIAGADSTNIGATAGAVSGNINLGTAGAPLHVDSSNIVQVTTQMMQCMAENNVPQEENEMFVVYPPAIMTLIKNSELKQCFLTGDDKSIIRQKIGYAGNIAGSRLFMSNLLPTATDSGSGKLSFQCPFGHKYGTTFATQITQREVIPNPKRFGKLLRQMQVYGDKVIKPTAVGMGYLTLA